MIASDFVLKQDFDVAPSVLHAFLCDLKNYVALHPLIESIEELSPSDELPLARRYRVVDRMPLGPFRVRTVYHAALDPVSKGEVHGYAWQFPAVQLHTIYALTTTELGTRLVERVSIRAPRLFRRFVVDQARRAHAETLSKMKRLLEAESEAKAEDAPIAQDA
jgi:hypothetical protein